MLRLLRRTKARRRMKRKSTAARPMPAAAKMAPRTGRGGSKIQSIAMLPQKAAPSQTAIAASPSSQT